MCDFVGCTKGIRESDKGLSDGAAKFCDEHGAVVDAFIDNDDPVGLFKWSLKNVSQTVSVANNQPDSKES